MVLAARSVQVYADPTMEALIVCPDLDEWEGDGGTRRGQGMRWYSTCIAKRVHV